MSYLRHLFTTWRIKREIERNLAAVPRAMPDGTGCDPTGSAASGVFVQASHPYRGESH